MGTKYVSMNYRMYSVPDVAYAWRKHSQTPISYYKWIIKFNVWIMLIH